MAWTPYVGDPYSQVNENHATVYTDNIDPAKRTSRGLNMGSRERLTTSMAGAVPYSQLTPDQAYFRDSVATGRWAADSTIGAHAPVNHMRRHADGTIDMVRLEAHGKAYLDLGGMGARDCRAARP